MQAILVDSHDGFLQVVFWDVVHPGFVFDFTCVDGCVLEYFCGVACRVLRDKACNVVHVEMRQVNQLDVVGFNAESCKAVQHLPAECAKTCIE